MKKENIQSRNRKLSAKARKKHSCSSSSAHFAPIADMIKPLEKMYGSYAGMHAAAAMGAAGMSSYYMPNVPSAAAAAAAAATGASSNAAAAAASPVTPSSAAQFAGAGMHMMSSALGGFGAAAAAACPPSFGGMVSLFKLKAASQPPFFFSSSLSPPPSPILVHTPAQFDFSEAPPMHARGGGERERERDPFFHKSFPGYFSCPPPCPSQSISLLETKHDRIGG